MFLSYRKKLLGCGLVLLVCLWVIYRTSQLAFQYDKLLASMQWEADRCIHKQGVDSMARVGSVDVFSHLSLGVYPEGLVSVSPAVLHHTARYFSSRAPEHLLSMCVCYLCHTTRCSNVCVLFRFGFQKKCLISCRR